MSTPSSVKWCLLAACVLCGAARSFAAEDDAVAAGAEPRQGGWLCTPADSAGVCLFKGVLKNVLSYASSRRRDAAVGAPGPVGGTDVQAQPKGIEEFLAEQIQNVFGMFSFGFDLPAEVTAPWTLLKSSFFNARGKKNKNLGPMLAAGLAVMAGTLGPLAFGALFMLAGKALMTSLLAITISGMLGLKSLFSKHEGGHLKSYSGAPVTHYTDAQYEQELGVYKGQTEAKMHSTAGNYYNGQSNLSSYYKGEQEIEESNQPEYYAPTGPSAPAAHPKFNNNIENHNNKITAEKSN